MTVFSHPSQLERAARTLQLAGIDAHRISIIGRCGMGDREIVGLLNDGGTCRVCGPSAPIWERLVAVLAGTSMMFVPGLGPVIVMGPLAKALWRTLREAPKIDRVSALGGALMALGMPAASVASHESALLAGQYILVVYGSRDDANKAHGILASSSLHLMH
ncbi:MAG: DUF1269 domain-containing protein [Ramlibacter sp.]|nr:DUF1269 domain-containing protein [Ramlibacter sp.]